MPNSWEQMKQNMMHNESVKTFEDISRHLELEAERLEAAKSDGSAMVVESSSRRTSQFKRGKAKGAPKKQAAAALKPNGARNFKRRGKRGGKKAKAKLTCFNCNKEGHFARDCPEQKKTPEQQTTSRGTE
ncbi:unnamed protein product [Camellia sinensis]